MICDMCGNQGKMYKAEVEGAILALCENCSKFGKVLGRINQHEGGKIKEKKAEEKPEVMDIIVDGYAEMIRKGRESMGLTQQDFAKKVNEKESLIHQLESGRFHPDIGLAKKLQKALGIMLVDEYEEKHEGLSHSKTDSFTIGDFIKIKSKPK